MPAQELSQLASAFGAPVTAVMLLVSGARALEKDANPHALKYVAGLLTAGDVASFGKLGPTLIPFIFDRLFGSNPLSRKFIVRSVLATTTLWVLLAFFRGVNRTDALNDIRQAGDIYPFIMLSFYVFDWLSLVKAKFVIQFLSQRYAMLSGIIFLSIDILGSYLIACCAAFCYAFFYWLYSLHEVPPVSELQILADAFMHLRPLSGYFGLTGNEFVPRAVIVPSTMLTSMWTLLLIVSGMLAQLLIPLDYLRRFTAWWFRDIENRPLTAIAKVGAALIVVGWLLMIVLRWI